MNINNKLEYIVNEVRNKAVLTGEYLINFGKIFLQHEYGDMGIKFVDKNIQNYKYKKRSTF